MSTATMLESSPEQTTTKTCALCDLELGTHCVVDGDRGFCCPGCHAVYQILSTKGELEGFDDHPIFQQAVKAGLISNPQLLDQIRRKQPHMEEGELQVLHLEVGEMWCPSCAEIIKLFLLRLKGVKNCVVDYTTDLASVEFSPRYVSKERIYEEIRQLGYLPQSLESAQQQQVQRGLILRLGISAFCTINIMMFSYPIYASYFSQDSFGRSLTFAWLSFIAVLPVVGYSAFPIFRRFWISLRTGFLGMETLVSLGVSAAFGLSLYHLFQGDSHVYFDSLSAIVTFVLLGKWIEAKAKFRAKDTLFQLSRSLPRKGRKRLEDGSLLFIPLKEVKEGDCLVAVAGETVVLDGVIVEGEGACDESLMTGESCLVSKSKGERVLGGSLLKSGTLTFQVERTAQDCALQQIIRMVEQDLGHKTSYMRAADRVVRWFVPAVLTLALTVAVFLLFRGNSLEVVVLRATSIILISCPCALGIAAPLAESLLIRKLAQWGVIVRNRGVLRLLGRESCFVFDKTGTVTEGLFTVRKGLETLSEEQKRCLKGLTQLSQHPLSIAITGAIDGAAEELDLVREIAGRGLEGEWKGRLFLLGSSKLMEERGVACEGEEGTGLCTQVYYAEEGKVVTQLELGDALKMGVKEVLRNLSPAQTALISGDSQGPVKWVQETCGFHRALWGCSPLNKREEVDALRKEGHIVAMLGDGINDAPALAGAHIGMSVVSATDLSIQVSDILFTTDRLSLLPKMRRWGRLGMRVIRQNLFWAFFYNGIGMGLAVSGSLSPLFAAIAMVLSSLLVIGNSLRLLREKEIK